MGAYNQMTDLFDRAWGIVKMPYYHGTSSDVLDRIMERGISPRSIYDGNWRNDRDGLDSYEFEGENVPFAFIADRPKTAMRYATHHVDSNEGTNQTAPNRPVIIEVADEVEDLEGFEFNPTYHDFRVPVTIPPSMLGRVYEGDEYPDLNDEKLLEIADEYGTDSEYTDRLRELGAIDFQDKQIDRLMDSDWYKDYMSMGRMRHPPFVRREGLV